MRDLLFVIVAFVVMYLGHEAGHLAISLAVGWKIKRVAFHPLGGIGFAYDMGGRTRFLWLAALGGPAVSLALGLVGLALMPGVWAFTFMVVNFSMLGAQLLPIRGSDGWVLVNSLRKGVT